VYSSGEVEVSNKVAWRISLGICQ